MFVTTNAITANFDTIMTSPNNEIMHQKSSRISEIQICSFT